MSSHPTISQRDLRTRSREIMDAVEQGETFTVTRDGTGIGELAPLRERRRFVNRADFVAMSRTAPDVSIERFRDDQITALDSELDDPYER